MSKQVLQMKYHPAKKEVEFHRFQNNKEVPIRSDSKLRNYMNLKGKFILQDYGSAFFEDITRAFDGEKTVDIEVITTKMDFEDFMQMVEYYNEGGKCKINATLLAELPDMNQTFMTVKKHGEESIGILQNHRQKLFEIPLENESVKKSAESFASEIDIEIKNIRDKIDSLNDNSVNLCFTGVYSAGKSALINALLGYKILPENITSETAKMLRISSPKLGESVKIKFDICNVYSELEWNEETQCFEFIKGPSESGTRTEIQIAMNAVKDQKLKQYEQIRHILVTLNANMDVSADIRILFPVALDTEKVQFTIYDTPGTDSNYMEHQHVLAEALEEQRQSILIFVAAPNKTEGDGNNALLNYLKEAEQKSSKTSIDIGRSLFAINWADSVGVTDRQKLQTQEIKNKDDDSFSIKLADKKLFFTSAKYAYAAKAVKNCIATEEEEFQFEDRFSSITNEKFGHYYRQNRCATSEFATGNLVAKCEKALDDAKKIGDKPEIVEICSGLFALESEILQYGEKFASAVKAFSIIDSVDKALSKLSNQANSLRDSNQEEIVEIEKSIEELRNTIIDAIEDKHRNTTISLSDGFPIDVLKKLKLDKTTLNSSIVGNTKIYIDKNLKGWFFGFGKVNIKDKDKDLVRTNIEKVIEDFTKGFLSKRKELLEEQRDDFIKAVKDTILQNGNISESAKKFFLNIPAPTVSKPEKVTDLGEIYDSHRRIDKGFIFDTEYLDKDGFIKDVEERLLKITGVMQEDYCKDYRNSLETLLTQIETKFKTNLATYSLYMKAMIENKDAMMRLGGRVSDAATALEVCQSELNKIIWKELKNA